MKMVFNLGAEFDWRRLVGEFEIPRRSTEAMMAMTRRKCHQILQEASAGVHD